MRKVKFIYLYTLICIIFFACSDKNNNVPHAGDDFWIYNIAADPSSKSLLSTNGYIYVTGGYNSNGILLYRQKMTGEIDDFLAFDRTCPYEVGKCKVKMQDESVYFCKCSCCGSEFNVLAGSVEKGPSEHFLTQLRCDFIDGSIHVY